MNALYVFDIDRSRKQRQTGKNVSLHFSQAAPTSTPLSNDLNNLQKHEPAKIAAHCSTWVKRGADGDWGNEDDDMDGVDNSVDADPNDPDVQ